MFIGCISRYQTRMAQQEKIIADFVGPHKAASMIVLAHGYETELPIQCVPDLVRLLSAENIAVYQVVRYAKTNGVWA